MRLQINKANVINKLMVSYGGKLDDAMDLLLDNVNLLTPEDTGKMIRNNKVQDVTRERLKLKTGIKNVVPYAEDVNEGMGKIFSYQKPKGNRGWYIGDGVHTYPRALEASQKSIINILRRNKR